MLPALPTGQHVDVRGVAEGVDDLERRALLALDPRRVDGVDQGDRVVVGQLAGERAGSRRSCPSTCSSWAPCATACASLPIAILPAGTSTAGVMPGLGGVGRGRGRGVAGRGADDGLRALVGGHRDGHRHPAVLERAGRVRARRTSAAPGSRSAPRASRTRPAACRPRTAMMTGASAGRGIRSRYSVMTPRQGRRPAATVGPMRRRALTAPSDHPHDPERPRRRSAARRSCATVAARSASRPGVGAGSAARPRRPRPSGSGCGC